MFALKRSGMLETVKVFEDIIQTIEGFETSIRGHYQLLFTILKGQFSTLF